jgi:hypothetical protein
MEVRISRISIPAEVKVMKGIHFLDFCSFYKDPCEYGAYLDNLE